MRGGQQWDRYTGKVYEADYLGPVPITPAYEAKLQELARGRTAKHGGPYVSFAEGVRLVKEFQPYDPTNPERELSRELRLAVIDALDIPEDQLDRVRVYTAVGTALDTLHHVDAFLEVDYPGSREPIRVTIDLTQNAAKAAEHGIVDAESLTHLIIGELPSPDDPRFLGLVGEVASAVTESVRRQRLSGSAPRPAASYHPPTTP